jgi:hypothetical protein
MRSRWKGPSPLQPRPVLWLPPRSRGGRTGERLRLYDGRRVVTVPDRPALAAVPLGSLVVSRRCGAAIHTPAKGRRR